MYLEKQNTLSFAQKTPPILASIRPRWTESLTRLQTSGFDCLISFIVFDIIKGSVEEIRFFTYL